MTRNHTANGTAGWSPDRARQVTANVIPMAKNMGETVRHGTHDTVEWSRPRVMHARSWAAPQLEHAGELVRDELAPRASSLLFSAAHKVDVPHRTRRWPKLIAGMAMVAAGASAAAALALRRRPGTVLHAAPEPAGDAGTESAGPAGRAAERSDGQPGQGESPDDGRPQGP